jgi:HEAT repeat protein
METVQSDSGLPSEQGEEALKSDVQDIDTGYDLKEKERTIQGFLKCIQGRETSIRSEILDNLLKYPDVATDALVIALLSDNHHARAMAAFALGQSGNPRISYILINATHDPCEEVRSWAVKSLGEIGDGRAIHPLINALMDISETVRAEAACALGILQNRNALDSLAHAAASDPVERVRFWAGMAAIQVEEGERGKGETWMDSSCVLHIVRERLDRWSPEENAPPVIVEEATMEPPPPVCPLGEGGSPQGEVHPLLTQMTVCLEPQVCGSEEKDEQDKGNDSPSLLPPGTGEVDMIGLRMETSLPAGPSNRGETPEEVKGSDRGNEPVHSFIPGIKPEEEAHPSGSAEISACPLPPEENSCLSSQKQQLLFSDSSHLSHPQSSLSVLAVNTEEEKWLQEAIRDPHPLVRCFAAGRAREMSGASSLPALLQLMEDENEEVRETAKSFFARIRTEEARERMRAFATGRWGGHTEPDSPFISLLADPNEDLQAWAVWALGEENIGAVPYLGDAVGEGTPMVRKEAIEALQKKGTEGISCLVKRLAEEDTGIRTECALALMRKGSVAIEPLLEIFNQEEEEICILASSLLSCMGISAVPPLIQALDTESRSARRWVSITLERMPSAREILMEASTSENRRIREGVLQILWNIPDLHREKILRQSLADPDPQIRKRAIESTARSGDHRLISLLIPLLNDEEEQIRLAGVRALGSLKDPICLRPLIKKLNDPSSRVRTAAMRSLKEAGKELV